MKTRFKPTFINEMHTQRNDTKTKQIDLRKPSDCKEFISSIKVDGRKLMQLMLADGSILIVDDMDDDQLIQYANQLYFDLFRGEEGGGFVNTDIDRGLQ